MTLKCGVLTTALQCIKRLKPCVRAGFEPGIFRSNKNGGLGFYLGWNLGDIVHTVYLQYVVVRP
jgi:hypothetical protein